MSFISKCTLTQFFGCGRTNDYPTFMKISGDSYAAESRNITQGELNCSFPKSVKLLYFIALFLGITLLIFSSCAQNPSKEDNDSMSYLQVPEGFVIEEAVSPDLISFPMFASFDDQGRLFVFESTGVSTMGTEKMLAEPSYHIRLLEDSDGDGKFDKSTIYVDSIPLPMGGTFYQGSLYAAAPPNLMRYTDTDNDGIADKKDVILNGWVLNANAATLHGPFMGPDGWLYLCDARRGFDITTKEGAQLKGKGARIWRCRPDGTGLESVAGGGFDNTIEMVFMPGGETIGTMTYFTDPQNGQRDALMHWVEGGVYPKYNCVIDEDQLKLTGDLMPVMTKLPRIAHSGLLRYRGEGLGKEYNGNLFSAVFNTGKITRHRVTAVGATFKTVEEDFMTSKNPDTHPTDVLQDADGSLLVIITGGWFIEGCPLSRVAKPDVAGGIYRIRRKDASPVKDPWGKALELSKISPEELAGLINDSRVMVKDAVVEKLVAAGSNAVPALVKMLQDKNEDSRLASLFALARIGSKEAIAAVRGSLQDNSATVRTAASRSLGLAEDRESVDMLMQLVQKDSASVRRQAATALGQIGDPRCIPALLSAASNPNDRFVEHSIIHSLITLKKPELLIPALNHASEGSRKAAVIALDQMDNSPLRQEQVLAFLQSKQPALRNTGIWIASHRPAWADMVISFLQSGLNMEELNKEELAAVQKLLITFSENPKLQGYMAKELGNNQAFNSWKQLLLTVISESPVKDFPNAWTLQLGNLLRSGNDVLQRSVLALIESRRLAALNNDLAKIIEDNSADPDFRIGALGARGMTVPELSAKEFSILTGFLKPPTESPIRQSAARLLARAKLNEGQQKELAEQYVGTADLFLLPSLMTAFEGSKSEAVGLALIKALSQTKDRLDNLSEQDMEKLLANFPEKVQKEGKPLMDALRARHAERLSKLEQLEESLSRGDLERGKKVFFGKAACFTCHAVGQEGAHFGPDLSNIGEIRSSHDILEAIVYPSVSFAREYDTYQVKTKTKTYLGVIKEQFPDLIILAVGPGAEVRIPRAEIVSSEQHAVSMMPPGLEKSLSQEELSDLMAYLKSLPDSYKTMNKQ